MKKLLLLALMPLIQAHAEVYYFSGLQAPVPAGEVSAVEVRAAAGKQSGSWAVGWSGAELLMTLGSDSYVDGVDRLSGLLTVNGRKFPLKDFVEPGGANSLAVEWSNDSVARILVGHKELREVCSLVLVKPDKEVVVEGLTSPFELIDLIVETNPSAFGRLTGGYSQSEIENGKQWKYLDREGDSRIAVVGGQYRLSQIGMELIYVDGAKTNPDSWKPGMVKGRLIPTGFDGYYKLQWFDATGRELSGENYAEVDSDLGILKLTFPLLKTSVRFHD